MSGSSAGGERCRRAARPCLGLLVTREAHGRHVFDLAEAAGNKGIDLLVHLTGTGVLLIRNDRFEHLCRRCRVSVCHESAQTHDLLPLLRARHPELLASCNQLAGAFLACGRRLVF